MFRWYAFLTITAVAISLIAGCPEKNDPPGDEPPVVDANGPAAVDANESVAVVEPNRVSVEPNDVPVEPNEPVAVEPNEPPADVNEPVVDVNEPVIEPNEAPNDVNNAMVDANEPPVDANEAVVEPNEPPIDVNTPAVVDANTPVDPNAVEPPDANQVTISDANGPPDANMTGTSDANHVGSVDPNTVDVNEAPKTVAFHGRCAEIFETYVADNGLVDYARLSRQRLKLQEVLALFDDLDPAEYASWPEADQTAFWVNAYNLQMLHIIARNYPIESSPWLRTIWGSDSIRHIKGIWTDYKFLVMREQYTLDELDKRHFRKASVDPKVLLALHWGCLSGPPLRRAPYTGTDLDKQLDEQIRRFLADTNNLLINRSDNEVVLSSLFQTSLYGQAFMDRYSTDKRFKSQPATTAAVLNFISRYLGESQSSYLEVGTYSVKWSKFDWTVNDVSKQR